MRKYNVTVLAPRALRNITLAVSALSARSLRKKASARLNSTVLLRSKTSKWDKVGANKTVKDLIDKKRARAEKPNVTLVYQGHIVAKFATIASASDVMHHD
jgi:PBP1b-binding outer membrane lipoprotein LpoB